MKLAPFYTFMIAFVALLLGTCAASADWPAGWKPCASISKDRVTIHEEDQTFSAPRWAIAKLKPDYGIAWISNHGVCNEKLHRVVICRLDGNSADQPQCVK